jgi:hypothetical protein
LLLAKFVNFGIRALTFHAAIPTQILVDAVIIAFAIRFIVFLARGEDGSPLAEWTVV